MGASHCIEQKSMCVCWKLWEREEKNDLRKEKELPGNCGRQSGDKIPSQKMNPRL